MWRVSPCINMKSLAWLPLHKSFRAKSQQAKACERLYRTAAERNSASACDPTRKGTAHPWSCPNLASGSPWRPGDRNILTPQAVATDQDAWGSDTCRAQTATSQAVFITCDMEQILSLSESPFPHLENEKLTYQVSQLTLFNPSSIPTHYP